MFLSRRWEAELNKRTNHSRKMQMELMVLLKSKFFNLEWKGRKSWTLDIKDRIGESRSETLHERKKCEK